MGNSLVSVIVLISRIHSDSLEVLRGLSPHSQRWRCFASLFCCLLESPSGCIVRRDDTMLPKAEISASPIRKGGRGLREKDLESDPLLPKKTYQMETKNRKVGFMIGCGFSTRRLSRGLWAQTPQSDSAMVGSRTLRRPRGPSGLGRSCRSGRVEWTMSPLPRTVVRLPVPQLPGRSSSTSVHPL